MNSSKFPSHPFLSSKATALELFNISMDEDTFVELGWYAYRDIGNIAIDNYVAKLPVDSRGIIKLPENFDTMEAVTTMDIPLETLGDGYQIYDSGIPLSRWFFTQTVLNETVRYFDLSQSGTIAPGELISYTFIAKDKIQINTEILRNNVSKLVEVYVVYKGVVVDDMCLPMLTFKESQAVAYRVAFLKIKRDAFMMKPGAIELLQYIKTQSARLMQAAKIPEYIDQNEFDTILNAMTSWDRKTYGRSFKAYSGR